MNLEKIKYQTMIEYSIVLLLFVGGANFFVFLKTGGLTNLDQLIAQANTVYSLEEIYSEVSFLGLAIGIQIILFQTYLALFLQKQLHKRLFQLFWILAIFAIIIVNGILIRFLFLHFAHDIRLDLAWNYSNQFIITKIFISFIGYFFMIGFLVCFVRQLRQNFGEAVFFNFLVGKYSQVREEERSFLFIDLNNSTYIAEFLGHTKYSRFITQCFSDILAAIQDFKYDVYQYVGDEVILTWSPKIDKNGQAILMYNCITECLINKQEFYETTFGITPKFKASVHTGFVASSLVGRKNKILAYHGDVVNTTARLLELCKKYNKGILFTQKYLESISNIKHFTPTFLIDLKLRGKNQNSAVFHA